MVDRSLPLRVKVGWDGVAATITVSGELDITTAPRLVERLTEVVGGRPERLLLDLSGLVFMDVAGVRALDGAHKVLEAICPVVVRDPHPSARGVPEVTDPLGD